MQFYQGNWPLVEGASYVVSFDAKADGLGEFDYLVGMDHDPWHNLGLSLSTSVGTSWSTYRMGFTAGAGDADARVGFQLGTQGPRTVWFDNIHVERYTPFVSPGLLSNTGFEQALAAWTTQLAGGGDATFTSDSSDRTEGDRSLRVDVLAIDGTDWHVQFYQGGWPIVAGQSYVVSFDARTDVPGELQ